MNLYIQEHPWLSKVRPVKTDQTARMRRLIWIFAGRTCLKVRFLTLWLNSLMPIVLANSAYLDPMSDQGLHCLILIRWISVKKIIKVKWTRLLNWNRTCPKSGLEESKRKRKLTVKAIPSKLTFTQRLNVLVWLRLAKTYFRAYAESECPDQPAHLRNLIRAFPDR